MQEERQTKLTCTEMLDEVEAAFIDVISEVLQQTTGSNLDDLKAGDLFYFTDLSKERCCEILRLYKVVLDRYEKRHGISK